MSDGRDWQFHALSGMYYFKILLGDEVGYEFENGRRFTQREFDQLKTDPRFIPEVQTEVRQPDVRQPDVGSSPPQHYFLAPGNVSTHQLSPVAADFVRIPMGCYNDLYSFVVKNPAIVSHVECDALIAQARVHDRAGDTSYAQRLVHHALLIRRCRGLRLDQYAGFFSPLGYQNSVERQTFVDSVKLVYDTIHTPARATPQQSRTSSLGNQGRDAPRVVQSNTYAVTPQSLPGARSQHEEAGDDRLGQDRSTKPYPVRDKHGNVVYQDVHRTSLRPARSKYDSNRHQRESDGGPGNISYHREDSDVARMNTEMSKLSMVATYTKGRAQDEMPVSASRHSYPPEDINLSPRPRPPPQQTSTLSPDPRLPPGESQPYRGGEINATEENEETLDRRYSIRKDAENFFVPGRVFAVLWHENAGERWTLSSNAIEVTRGKFGEAIYSHIVRMTVVKGLHGACVCVPVHTYGGRGVSKSGFSKADRAAHSIIHMSDTSPMKLRAENDMNKKPIAVDKASPDQKLDKMSRINFARVHTVNWNVKVMNVGKVTRESMPALISYWRDEL